MTARSLVPFRMLMAATVVLAACRSNTTSVPLPSADSAAIMAKAHAAATTALSQVQKPAVYVGGTSVSPHPASAGETVIQFVVDSTGAVRPSTLKVIHVNDVRLVEDTKHVMGKWRYLPAEANGHKVSQLVETAIVR